MSSKVALIATLSAIAGLAIAPTAGAVSLQDQRVVAKPTHAAHSASTPIASEAACPGQTDASAPAVAQEEAMRCMTDYARQHLGLPPLAEAETLDASSRAKSGDILRCDDFSHFACGREFTYWIEASGYLTAPCWRAGENLAWGTGEEGTVRSIFRAWMRSPGHRQNILGDFSQIGISLQIGELAGQGGTYVWTQHFGSHC